jgi:hypothetical protein
MLVDTAPPTTGIEPTTSRTSSVYNLVATVRDDGGIARIVVTIKRGTTTLSNKSITVSGNATYALTQKLSVGYGPATVYITVTDKAGNSRTELLDI